MKGYKVGIGSVPIEGIGKTVTVLFHTTLGHIPFNVYAIWGDTRIPSGVLTDETDAIKAIAEFVKRYDVLVGEIDYLYTAYSGGWGIMERCTSEEDEEGWKLLLYYDRIAEQERRRGA